MSPDYEHLSATELHRERARLLRIVVMQRWLEMKVIVANAEGPSIAAAMAEADSGIYERVLKLDAELETLATEKEPEPKE